MADYESLNAMINTTENMVHLVNNVAHDDDTMTFEGADWFIFDGVKASQLFVSGNSWVGLGSNSEQLQVCRRDDKMWNFYREEATLFGYYRVLKIRWEGYAQYNSTSSDVQLIYEWFFIENGDMMLNIIKAPASSGYLGNSRINGGTNQNFTVAVSRQQYISFKHIDDEGRLFSIDYDMLDVLPPFERKYILSDKDGKYYKVVHDKSFIDALEFKGCQLIRTGIIPDQNTKVAVRFKTSQFGDYCLFGTRKSTNEDKYGVFLSSATQLDGQFGTESKTEAVDDYSDVEMVVELSAGGLKRDGVVIADYSESVFTAPCELTVGAMNTNGSLDSRMYRGLVYEIEVWQSEEKILDLVPCIDEKMRVCFYDIILGGCFYNEGAGTFGYEDTNGEVEKCTHIEEVEFEELTSDFFRMNGFDDFPRSEVLSRLVNPKLLYWQDSDTELPSLIADIVAVPPPQVVYSKNNEMTDSTILGIEKVEIEADDSTLFAFSFDAGKTWKAYIDNMWVNLSERTSGMNKETVEAIGTDVWAIAKETNQYMVRFTLLEEGYVNRVIIHYLN